MVNKLIGSAKRRSIISKICQDLSARKIPYFWKYEQTAALRAAVCSCFQKYGIFRAERPWQIFEIIDRLFALPINLFTILRIMPLINPLSTWPFPSIGLSPWWQWWIPRVCAISPSWHFCDLCYNKFGGIVMRFKDEMKDFLTSVPGKLLLFLFGIEVITLIWLFQWP